MTHYLWRHMQVNDLNVVHAISKICHPSFPEDLVVLADKLSMGAESCFVLEAPGTPQWAIADSFINPQTGQYIVGYALAHPYQMGEIPPLNKRLGSLPARLDCLYMHDIALMPCIRGRGAVSHIIQKLVSQARAQGYQAITGVSVNNSGPIWQNYGFDLIRLTGKYEAKILSYGTDALFMQYKLLQDAEHKKATL